MLFFQRLDCENIFIKFEQFLQSKGTINQSRITIVVFAAMMSLCLFLDSLRVTTSIYPVPSICSQDQISDWFDSLAECLHWNVRKRQKHLDELSDLTHSTSNDTLDSLDHTEQLDSQNMVGNLFTAENIWNDSRLTLKKIFKFKVKINLKFYFDTMFIGDVQNGFETEIPDVISESSSVFSSFADSKHGHCTRHLQS